MGTRRDGERVVALQPVGEREIVVRRDVEAPRAVVFEAWTTPALAARWMAGGIWTMPVCEIDLRVGGAWRYVMHGPGGLKMGMKGVYREIVPAERIVTTESFDDGEGRTLEGRLEMFIGESIHTLTLEEHDGVTTATWRFVYPSRAARDHVLGAGMQHGMGQAFDCLEKLLEEQLRA